MTKVLIGVLALWGLAGTAQASAIAVLSVFVDDPLGSNCNKSLTGLGTVNCSAIETYQGFQDFASAAAQAQDYTITLQVTQASLLPLIAGGSVDLERDDLYNIAVNGPVVADISVHGGFGWRYSTAGPSCTFSGVVAPCGNEAMLLSGITVHVPLTAINNLVELRSSLQATNLLYSSQGGLGYDSGGVQIQISVLGFHDANGNAVAASLIPEPPLTGMIGLIFLAMLRWKAKSAG